MVEARPLEIPAGLARDFAQLTLADEPGLLGWQKQDVLLNRGSEQPKNDNLADAGRRYVCQARQFGMVFHLAGPNQAVIGAYAPPWFMREQHVDPDEAVQIMEDLEAVRAVVSLSNGIESRNKRRGSRNIPACR